MGGARVFICSRNEAEIHGAATALQKETGSTVKGMRADVSIQSELAMFVNSAISECGCVDIAVLNGPQPKAGPFRAASDSDWATAINETVLYLVHAIHLTLPGMVKQKFGRCILIGSSFPLEPSPEFILSSTLRMTEVAIFKCLATTHAADGVTFNTICPGYVDTVLTHHCAAQVGAATGSTENVILEKWRQRIPGGVFTDAKDVGKLAVFLASLQQSTLTGQTIGVDGGASRAI